MDRFALLIADFSTLIDIPLHLDHRRTCTLFVNNQLHVQLKEEEHKDRILIGAFLAQPPPGKFRETIFKAALKENNNPSRIASFSYSERNNQLALFSYLTLTGLKGDHLVTFLKQFLDTAFSWRTGIETGQLPGKGQHIQKTGPSIFDVQKK